ncbi:MAG: hypothetical protein Q9167_003513 [Letrouitia subvulpina]
MGVSIFSALTVLTALFPSQSSAAGSLSYNGLAKTPQMGWNDWNAFGCDVDQELLLDTAQLLVDYGLRDLGYNYVVLDDCWANMERSDNGLLVANATKFPDGMKHISDQLHSMGLKFGMYSSAGFYTCAQYPASLGKEQQDAQTFADWGVDYLKYDNCYNGGQSGSSLITYNRYKVMSDALNQTGRPILYGMCEWGTDYPWNWAQTMANSWRMSGDIYDSFNRPDDRCPCTTYDCSLPGYHCSVMNIINKMPPIANKGQPGAWNDMDSLEVGNGGMSDDEAILKSPMIIGTDVTKMDAGTLSIYSNAAVLAISQDPLGVPAFRVWSRPASVDEYGQGEISLWSGELSGGDYAVALLNAGNTSTVMSASLADIFIDSSTTGGSASPMSQTWDVYDLWANRMGNAEASAILSGNATYNSTVRGSTVGHMNSSTRYNSTSMSYGDGVKMNSTALLGAKIKSVPPMGTLQAEVPRHGVAMYRLRTQGGATVRKRDEL